MRRRVPNSSSEWSEKAGLALLLLAILCFGLVAPAGAESGWAYGSRGLEWAGESEGTYLWLGLRAQPRHSSYEGARSEPGGVNADTGTETEVNRARYKIGAGYRGLATAYHEYDLRDSRLLDLRATWVANPKFKLRAGQWKAEYNRERIDSSGKQQFVERSISTYWFTIDRQWGAMTSGRAMKGARGDANWWAGVLGGVGRGNSSDGGRPMLMSRWQWNYTGEPLPFSQSGLKRYTSARGSLSFAAVTNDSRYTRFSSAGGGKLKGYDEGRDNQYRVNQAMQEWAWQRGGLSFQQELHWKSIRDRVNGGTRHIVGGYLQGGWFPAERWDMVSPSLELALRAAYVRPDSESDIDEQEYTVAANWFFNGHRNKISADLSYLSGDDNGREKSEYRFRLQWDISI